MVCCRSRASPGACGAVQRAFCLREKAFVRVVGVPSATSQASASLSRCAGRGKAAIGAGSAPWSLRNEMKSDASGRSAPPLPTMRASKMLQKRGEAPRAVPGQAPQLAAGQGGASWLVSPRVRRRCSVHLLGRGDGCARNGIRRAASSRVRFGDAGAVRVRLFVPAGRAAARDSHLQ